MRITEIVLGMLGLIGAVMSLLFITGGNIITVCALTLLILLNMIFGFAIYNGIRFRKIFKRDNWKNISSLQILGGIAAGFSASALIVGILYKILIWPGSTAMLQSGLFFCLITIVVGSVKRKQSQAPIYSNTFKRMIIYGSVALICIIVPTNAILEFKYSDYPEYLEAKKNILKDPSNPALWKAEREAFDEMMRKKNSH